jgi:cell division septation protein DedD
MTEEQPRGVHLTDKHIVFGVMAASVAVVVAFLCGVFVGRGVQALRPLPSDSSMTAPVVPDAAGVPADIDQPAASMPRDSSGTPTATPDALSYPDRLGKSELPPESLKLETSEPGPPQPQPDASADAEPAGGEAASAAAGAAPAGTLTVQIAAVRRRAEAQAIVDRLIRKGFPAYVFVPPGGDRAGGFRVRVGSYSSRSEAEAMAARLKKEEQYKPWITR